MTDAVDVSPDLPKLPRLPRTARGIARVQPIPTGLGRTRLGLPVLAEGEEQPRSYGDPPEGFDGTTSEWAIYWAATLIKGEPGELWSFKTPLLGDVSLIGFVPDFSLYDERVAIDVVDVDAPEEQQAGTRAAAIIRRAVLTRFAYTYIVIESDDAEENPVALLQDALIGIDHSRFGAG